MEKIRAYIKPVFLLVLAAVVAVIWYAVFYAEARQNLAVTFFDVGQGDAIFIETPAGNQILVDGGPDDRILAKLGRAMPFWDRSIDLLILTHPHADHLDGLVEVIRRYDVAMVLESGANHSIPEYDEWHDLLKDQGVNVVIAMAGQRVRLAEATYLDVLAPFENFQGESPPNIHDATVVTKLTYGSATLLLMGDAEKMIEYRLMSEGVNIDADILKAGHHGSKTSSSEEFLKAVSPDVAVISSGRKNRYGHPHQDVLDRLQEVGIKILRTDLEGDIRLISGGSDFLMK